MSTENRLRDERLKKIETIRSMGINPYPYKFNQKHHAKEILEKFKKLKKEEKTKNKVSMAGRIMTLRKMGKASFAHLQDESGKIQFYIRQDEVGEKNYKVFKLLDIGDIIGIEGIVFKTKTGEVSVWVKKIELLTKSLKPLPEKWHGLKDVEARYRQRYLDTIMNPEVKEAFNKRMEVINAMREFLLSEGYIEVETPILQPIYGGTNARPFKTFLNDLKIDVYLRISNEMYLKRLIAGGYEKIFEFSKDFRNEGIDRTHNPEFMLLETMWAYANYEQNMDLTEKMVEFVAKKVLGKTKFEYQGKTIDVKRPWQRLTMLKAIKKYTNIDVTEMDDRQIKEVLSRNNIILEGDYSRGIAISLIFEELVEEKLIEPTIIYDFPAETCVLAKKKLDNPDFAERFEPYINGWELGNSYSEENRPEILKKEWEKEEGKLIKGDEEAQRMDEDFITALEVGMPPTSGLGIGVERLAILIANVPSIRDVLPFPFMKPLDLKPKKVKK